MAVLFLYIARARRLSPTTVETTSVQPKSGEVMSYVVTYLIPFLDFDLGKTEDMVALLILLVVLAVIYINSNMVTVNPVLSSWEATTCMN